MSQCHVCGMVYSKGQPDDEKLHKQQHQVHTQGLQLQVGLLRLPTAAYHCLLQLPPLAGGWLQG
jgi:hypothetical protein